MGGSGTSSIDEITSIRNRHLKILLIDDRDTFRESMIFRLTEKYDAEVSDVDSGREAIKLLKAGDEFDIILLDIMMPDMDGIETYKELRKADATCRVVMMSAHPDSEKWKEAEKLNVELVQKPIPNDALTSILSRR
jgi:DNA-binding NtrC family response regulator